MPSPNNQSGKRRINIAGGEPSLDKSLPQLLEHAKSQGLSTSLITNGSVYLKNPKKLSDIIDKLDMIGVSVDSVDKLTNSKIQRPHHSVASWLQFAKTVRAYGVYLKVNTTVCRFNATDNLVHFIGEMAPSRWKILRAIAIGGTVGTSQYCPKEWMASDSEFDAFVSRHLKVEPAPIIENEAALRGSYAMISPDGCFYDSTQGFYSNSDPILDVGVEEAFRQVAFSHQKFEERGGVFNIPVTVA